MRKSIKNKGTHLTHQRSLLIRWRSALTRSRSGRGEAVDLQVEALVPRDEDLLHVKLLPKILESDQLLAFAEKDF